MGRIRRCTGRYSAKVKGYGTIKSLGKVLYAPDLRRNLISVSQLTTSGFTVTMKENYCDASKIDGGNYVTIEGNKTVDGQYSVHVRQKYDRFSST